MVHRGADRPQALDRVVDPDRQRPPHRGQFVAELTVLVFGPDRDRHQGLQLEPVERHLALGEPAPQGAGGDGERDVVDGAAKGVLDLLELGEVEGRPGEAAAAADRRVERHPRRRAGEVPGDLPEAGEAVAGAT